MENLNWLDVDEFEEAELLDEAETLRLLNDNQYEDEDDDEDEDEDDNLIEVDFVAPYRNRHRATFDDTDEWN